jgi:hypothetical protein
MSWVFAVVAISVTIFISLMRRKYNDIDDEFTFVKFSKGTAKENPGMIKREFNSIILDLEKKARSLDGKLPLKTPINLRIYDPNNYRRLLDVEFFYDTNNDKEYASRPMTYGDLLDVYSYYQERAKEFREAFRIAQLARDELRAFERKYGCYR